MQLLKVMTAVDSDILTFTDFDFWGLVWSVIYRIMLSLYHIAPIVILLFIAVIVWKIYKNGQKDMNERKYP